MVPSSTESFWIGCAPWQFVRLDVNILVALILYQRNGDTTPYGTQTGFWSPVRWVSFWVANGVLLERHLVSECPRQVAILNVPGPRVLFSLGCLYFGPSIILSFFSFLFLIYFLFLSLLGQNAPAWDPHSLPLVNKCCCTTRSSSVRCMLIMANWKSISFLLLTSHIADWLPITNTLSSYNIMRIHRYNMSLCRRPLSNHPFQMHLGQLHHERVIE